MKGNLVHCYITGFTFNNIYGGKSDDYSRSITQLNYLPQRTLALTPWMKGMWDLSDHAHSYGFFDTLEEAQAEAQRLWPGCGFKTPAEFRKEYESQE